MEKQIKISVIVPVYNTEKFIEKCLDSILNQTLKEIEVIVINDGSTDNSLEKIKKYEKDSRMKIISRENRGLAFTRNEGILNGGGEYIYHIDSDDYLENNKVLEKLYQKCEEENLDILLFNYYQKYPKYKIIYGIPINKNIISKEEYIKNMLENNGSGIWSKLCKSSLYKKNNIRFSNNIFHGEDMIVSIKLGYFAHKIGKINEVYYNYVQHPNQGTKIANNEKILEDLFLRTKELEKFFIKENYFKFLKEIKFKMYYEYFKNRNKNIKYYKDVKKQFQMENKKELFNCEFYKELPIKNKIKFYFRRIFI